MIQMHPVRTFFVASGIAHKFIDDRFALSGIQITRVEMSAISMLRAILHIIKELVKGTGIT
ncbi:hypothetical protein IMCC1989_2165 [gamma proteobacterium IMCC1989]|nr:hypothetical protein IMCC1989_2165 [gamma proteobacterium IMCC1989]